MGNVDDDSISANSNSLDSLIKLHRIKSFQAQMQIAMESRLQGLQGASAEKEFQCKKIVALCTGIPIDKVEDVSIFIPCHSKKFLKAFYVDVGKSGHCRRERVTNH